MDMTEVMALDPQQTDSSGACLAGSPEACKSALAAVRDKEGVKVSGLAKR
jgi:ethanolamine utilization microcompartment shell protein EutL